MVINVNVQHNGGFLPGIIFLTQCYDHRRTPLNTMKKFCICSLWSRLNVLTFSPLTGGCSEGLDASRISFKLFQVLVICQIKTDSHRIKQFKHSSESNRVLHNGPVQVFVKTTHSFTQ